MKFLATLTSDRLMIWVAIHTHNSAEPILVLVTSWMHSLVVALLRVAHGHECEPGKMLLSELKWICMKPVSAPNENSMWKLRFLVTNVLDPDLPVAPNQKLAKSAEVEVKFNR